MPTPDEIRRHVDTLRQTLQQHNHAYYELAHPTLGDREYDELKRQLQHWESLDDRHIPEDSPSRTVGAGAPPPDADTEAHATPMLSIENVTSEQELRKFLLAIPRRLRALRDDAAKQQRADELARLDEALAQPVEFVVEMKIDGVSMALRYEGGQLVQALTRGDKRRGRKVLATVGHIPGIPHAQSRFPDGTVRGEIEFPRADFAALRDDPRLRAFKNERNAAAGLVNGIVNPDGLLAHLRMFTYMVVDAQRYGLATQMDVHAALKEAGFPSSPVVVHCPDADAVLAARDRLDAERWNLPFRTDGLVVKVNSLLQQEALGLGETAPHWARAYKFPESEAETTLRAIRVQVGKSGRLTPVGEFDPVLLDGSTIARASLHNATRIAALDLRAGDRILVHKAKEIIPQVVASLPEYRPAEAEAFAMPTRCPECGGPVREEAGRTVEPDDPDAPGLGVKETVRFHFCDNPSCAGQAKERLVHFCGRGAMDIEGFGDKVVEALWNAEAVRDPADLFDLTREVLMPLTKKGRELLAKEQNAPDAVPEADAATTRASPPPRVPDGMPSLFSSPPADGTANDASAPTATGDGSTPPTPSPTPKSVENQLAALEASKGRGLARVLAGLAIPEVGETVAQHLARHFETMDRLRAATADEIAAVEVGESATYRTLGRRGAKLFTDALRDHPDRAQHLRDAAPGDVATAASVSALAACLEGFAIKNVGPEKCAAAARHFGTAARLLDASPAEWELVEMGAGISRRTLGPVAGRAVAAYFAQPAHRDLVDRLAAAGVRMSALPVPGRRRRPASAAAANASGRGGPDVPAEGLFAHLAPSDAHASEALRDNAFDEDENDGGDEGGAFAGRTVVLTGTLPNLGRAEAKRMLEAAGAIVSGHVGASTDYVIAGEKAGSKLTQARKFNVPVLDEAAMRRMLDGHDAP